MNENKGLRFNEGKAKAHLIPPFSMEQLARVLTKGAEKYGENNYRKGMKWSIVIASLKRHLLDDREHKYLNSPKVALDVDSVLADFSKSFRKRIIDAGLELGPYDDQMHWKFPYKAHRTLWESLKKDKDFWLNLEPVCDPHLPFEPVAYITFRDIPSEWTEEWLVKNGFPCEKVYSITGDSKAETIKECGADIFVDDCYDTFVNLNKEGICTFLFDKPYNRKYDVGYKRIYELSNLLTGEHL